MAGITSLIDKGYMLPELQGLSLTKSSTGNLPIAAIQNSVNAPTLEDVNAKNWQGLSDSFKDGQLTPLTAILKGATGGVAMGKAEKAQAKRDEAQARLNALLEWQTSQQMHQAEQEDIINAARYASANRTAMGPAFQMAEAGNPEPLIGILNADESTARTLQRQLGGPEGGKLNGFHIVKGPDGAQQAAASFLTPDGQTVMGTSPISYDALLQSVTPEYRDARLAQQAAAQQLKVSQEQAATKASDEHLLTQASIGRDNAAAAKDNAAASGTLPSKPLSPTAIKLQQENLDAIGSLGQANDSIAKVVAQIDSGELDVGVVNRARSAFRNGMNASTPESRAVSDYQSTLKDMVNKSLLLNKGVQTEGDAQRAADAILAAPYDTAAVKQRLAELSRLNERAADLKKVANDTLRAEYGHDPLDYGQFGGQSKAASGPSIGTVEDGYRFKGGNPADQSSWERVQ